MTPPLTQPTIMASIDRTVLGTVLQESDMPAYVIGDVEVTNPEAYEEYRPRVPATVEKYGGKYLVRGGATETAEGSWIPNRMVVIEFSSMEQAKEWYNSPEYGGIREIRHRNANSNVIFVDGV